MTVMLKAWFTQKKKKKDVVIDDKYRQKTNEVRAN